MQGLTPGRSTTVTPASKVRLYNVHRAWKGLSSGEEERGFEHISMYIRRMQIRWS
jgi:hypothetical protein